MVVTAVCAASPDRPLDGEERRQQRQRIAAAALLENLDRGDLLLVGGVGVEHRRGAGLAHQLGDRRVGLLLERGVDQFDRVGIAALEDRFGGGAPGRGIGAHQGEAADRGADDAAELVVDLDLLDRARRLLADGLGGERVDQAVDCCRPSRR